MESTVVSKSAQSWGYFSIVLLERKTGKQNSPALQHHKYVLARFVFNKEEIKLGRIFLYAIQNQTIPFTEGLL